MTTMSAASAVTTKRGGNPTPTGNRKMSDTERREIEKLLDVLERFRDARSSLSVNQICVFLRVALNEGESVTDYTRRMSAAQSMMSRTLLDLSETPRNGEAGLGLLSRRASPTSLRDVHYYLSQRGWLWITQIADTLLRRK